MAWTVRHGWLLWAVAVALAIPATLRTVSLYRHLKSDLEELLPRESKSVRALDEMRDRLPGLQYLGVVVDTGTAENMPAAERFLDDLAARIRTYPPDMVREVRTGNAAEKKFVENHAPLYVDLSDLKEVLRRIEARRDYEVSKESGSLLDEDEKPPPLDTSDIEKKYDHKLSDKKNESGRFSDAQAHTTLLFVEAGEFTTGADKARALLERVKADARALGGPEKYAPGMRVGYSSDVAISVEELDALEADLSISSIVVIALEIAVIVLYFRWWRAIAVLFPPLLLATVYAFGLASLPPANVTDLNSNTAFLGSIIVGNGINVGIVLLARYREARRTGLGVDDALAVGIWGSKLGTLAAAFAAAASYASLILTEFRGFRQFGYIGGAGMVCSWITAFVLMPPLLKWIDREETAVLKSEKPSLGIMGRVVSVVERWPVPIVAVALALTAMSAFAVSRFTTSTQLESDFSKLRRVDTWENGDGYWGRKVDNLLGRYLTPSVVLTDSPEQAREAERKVRDSVDHGPLGPMVASVRSADDVLPTDQAAKIAVVADIREALTPKIRSLVDEDRRKKLDDLLGPEDLSPVQLADLPHSFTTGLLEKDGTLGKTVLVYPAPLGHPLARAGHALLRVRAAGDRGEGRGLHPAVGRHPRLHRAGRTHREPRLVRRGGRHRAARPAGPPRRAARHRVARRGRRLAGRGRHAPAGEDQLLQLRRVPDHLRHRRRLRRQRDDPVRAGRRARPDRRRTFHRRRRGVVLDDDDHRLLVAPAREEPRALPLRADGRAGRGRVLDRGGRRAARAPGRPREASIQARQEHGCRARHGACNRERAWSCRC